MFCHLSECPNIARRLLSGAKSVARNFMEQKMKEVLFWRVQFSNLVSEAPTLHDEIGIVKSPLRKRIAHHDVAFARIPVAKALRHATDILLGDAICSAPLKHAWHDLQSVGLQSVMGKDTINRMAMI
jgi:hypothetical protein